MGNNASRLVQPSRRPFHSCSRQWRCAGPQHL